MASRCHGICSRLPHEKVVRWLSDQMKKLFRYCSKCELFILHTLDTIYCKCCGCKLRMKVHRSHKRSTSTHRTKLWRMRHPEEYRKRRKSDYDLYGRDYKLVYYQKNREKLIEKARLYKLKTKLLKIFFITMYPHLIVS